MRKKKTDGITPQKGSIADLMKDLWKAAFIPPETARWSNIIRIAQTDDIKIQLDNILEGLENAYPERLRGLLPRIYAGSNLDADNVRGLINLFSKDIFSYDHGGEDVLGRVYEYFIGKLWPEAAAWAPRRNSPKAAVPLQGYRVRNSVFGASYRLTNDTRSRRKISSCF